MMYLMILFALLSIIIKDFFYSIIFFSLFNLSLSVYLIAKKLLYLAIFQFGMFVGTLMLVLMISIGE